MTGVPHSHVALKSDADNQRETVPRLPSGREQRRRRADNPPFVARRAYAPQRRPVVDVGGAAPDRIESER